MLSLSKVLVFVYFAQSGFGQDNFSAQLQEAIKFCGGLQALTDGACPNQGPVQSQATQALAPAKNIKLCKAKDTPGLTNPSESWRDTALKNVKLNAYFNATNGRYGFGGGPFLIQINFEAPEDITFLAGRVDGFLPELPRKTSFEKDLCNPFLADPCRTANGGSRCPVSKGTDINYVARMPFSGSYRKDLPVDLRIELYSTNSKPATCVNQENLSSFGEPILCFIVQGYIL